MCWYKDLTCHKCGKVGHIANACKSVSHTPQPATRGQSKASKTNAIDKEEDVDDDLGWFNIDVVSSNSAPIRVAVHLNGRKVVMMVDTGAAVTHS